MRTQKTQGVILKRRTLGEKDYAVTLFTPLLGKIDANAKGARRVKSKFTGHLDLLNICNFELYNSPKNNIITECQLHRNYARFRDNLNKFYFSCEIAKILYTFTTENENNEEIYDLVIKTFEALDKLKEESLIFETFKVKLFLLIGIMPDVNNLSDTEFANLDNRLKKLLKFLLIKSYEEIVQLPVTKKDILSLQKLTSKLREYLR